MQKLPNCQPICSYFVGAVANVMKQRELIAAIPGTWFARSLLQGRAVAKKQHKEQSKLIAAVWAFPKLAPSFVRL